MQRPSLLISILVFASQCVIGVYNLDYSDLEGLGVSCPRRDSCRHFRPDMTFHDRNCECDSSCTYYRDCCINSPYRSLPMGFNEDDGVLCVPFGDEPNTGVYAVKSCDADWSGHPKIQQKCEGPDDFTDPLNAAPVLDTEEMVTYKNRYCAECNQFEPTNVTTFQILIDCETLSNHPNITEEYVWKNLEYNSKLKSWGVYSKNSNPRVREFHSCRLLFNLPEYLAKNVRMCRSNAISTCLPDWKDASVKRACETYTAIIYGHGGKVYKNPHCALCNGESMEDFTCEISSFGNKKPLSFVLLVDVNGDGDEVGMSKLTSCSQGEKYDPFFHKCRPLVCALPGFVMVDGTCIRGSG